MSSVMVKKTVPLGQHGIRHLCGKNNFSYNYFETLLICDKDVIELFPSKE